MYRCCIVTVAQVFRDTGRPLRTHFPSDDASAQPKQGSDYGRYQYLDVNEPFEQF